jgi:hypothetical protein
MTSAVGRLSVVVAALLVFLVLWAAVTAHPWVHAAPDPRLAALDARQQRLDAQLVAVQSRLAQRWATYRATIARQGAAPAAPAVTPHVRIVQLPPVATTRTS